MTKRTLLIDDVRELEADVTMRDYFGGIWAIDEMGPWDVLLLDHDLASYDANGKEFTGYDVMLHLEELAEMGHFHKIPKEIRFVTSNPVGRQKMEVVKKRIYAKIEQAST